MIRSSDLPKGYQKKPRKSGLLYSLGVSSQLLINHDDTVISCSARNYLSSQDQCDSTLIARKRRFTDFLDNFHLPNDKLFQRERRLTDTKSLNIGKSSHQILSGVNALKISKLLETNTTVGIKLKNAAILAILHDPIQCGYLLNFTECEHNSENLCFIMMVSRFRDAFNKDIDAWSKSWTEIDREITGQDEHYLTHMTTWPSTQLLKPTIGKMAQAIWDEFLSDTAKSQIFMSAKVATNTKRRMLLLDLYGPDIFSEALLDPINTINNDILPRFLASKSKVDMDQRIQLLKTKLTQSDIQIPPPIDDPLLKPSRRSTFRARKLFTLNEILNNRTLYDEYLKYLESKLSHANLLCIRMINIFEDLCMDESSESLVEATDCAWKIYQYFLAKGAPYEMSLQSKYKKEIMISLAKVHIQMFDELEKFAMSALTISFNNYKTTDDYNNLKELLEKQMPVNNIRNDKNRENSHIGRGMHLYMF